MDATSRSDANRLPVLEPRSRSSRCRISRWRFAWVSALALTACRSNEPAPAHPANSAPIVYFEVVGPDGKKLSEFFSKVFGWSIDAKSTIAAASAGVRGGIRQDPPATVLYLGVPDVSAKLAEIEHAGGKVILPRTAVPGVVTFALFQDPAGNVMGLAEFGSYPK